MHSQRRFVKYYEYIARERKLPEPTYVRLEKIRMHTIPTFKKGGSGLLTQILIPNVEF